MNLVITSLYNSRANFLRLMTSTLNDAVPALEIDRYLYHHNPIEPPPEDLWGYNHRYVNSPDCHHAFVDMLNAVFKERPIDSNMLPDWALNVDADAIVHPQLLGVVEQAVDDLPDAGAISFFNEDCHPDVEEYYKDKYTIRQHTSFLCLLVKREAWLEFKPPEPGQPFEFGCVDGMFTTWISRSNKYKLYCTVRSYADHLGFGGTHASEDKHGKGLFSRARRFYS